MEEYAERIENLEEASKNLESLLREVCRAFGKDSDEKMKKCDNFQKRALEVGRDFKSLYELFWGEPKEKRRQYLLEQLNPIYEKYKGLCDGYTFSLLIHAMLTFRVDEV